jgi:hypothetical protein
MTKDKKHKDQEPLWRSPANVIQTSPTDISVNIVQTQDRVGVGDATRVELVYPETAPSDAIALSSTRAVGMELPPDQHQTLVSHIEEIKHTLFPTELGFEITEKGVKFNLTRGVKKVIKYYEKKES